ncbi:hypothetical protein N7488_002559 [Penicillium malachiteum]|nr:hypothetical protein N7488_002559 [Penicillium malachiteum]
MSKYAKDQSADFKNTIERVAIVGAGGTIGSPITNALLKTGKHTVTGLSRKDSGNKLPEGVVVATVDYNDEATIVAALKGQQFLIITMAPTVPKGTHSTLVQAAAKAGVPYVMPNWWAADIENTKLGEDTFLGPKTRPIGRKLKVSECSGSLCAVDSGGESRFGFDLSTRSLTLYDDGNTRISTTTLSQVACAVAKILSLNELPKDENDKNLTLSTLLNKGVFIRSFFISQNEMFESVKRVTGTTDVNWIITNENTTKRYGTALAQVKVGNMSQFSKMLYARVFYPDGSGDLSDKSQNELLALPNEDLDQSTTAGIDLVAELERRAERMAA